MNHHAAVPIRPSWDHETNHIGSPAYHPDDHFGLLDDNPDDHNHNHINNNNDNHNNNDNNNGYAVNEASSFTHHTYDEFEHNKPSHHQHIGTFNEANIDDDDDDDGEHYNPHHSHEYRPTPGTETYIIIHY